MRTVYRETLDAFSHDLIVMCDSVHEIMAKASDALLKVDLQSAEDAMSLAEPLEEIRQRCEARAVELLALENPMARDLRQVISSIYIVDDIARMGALAMHIARAARRRHPQSVLPEALQGYFAEMTRLNLEMTDKVRNLLIDPDADVALVLTSDDDAVDDLHNHLLTIMTQRDWPYTTTNAVDITLLSRFYERFADHSVNVAGRIVYLITGLTPAEYTERRRREVDEAEMKRRFADLERRFATGR